MLGLLKLVERENNNSNHYQLYSIFDKKQTLEVLTIK